jgi:inhibitor of KinA
MKAISPLGDQAALAYFEDEAAAIDFARWVQQSRPPWLVDVVSAYRSVAVFFDLEQTCFAEVAAALRDGQPASPREAAVARFHIIPCCYDLALDLDRVAAHTGLSRQEVIALHSGQDYTVYAIGFCPGFPYLGYLHPRLCDVPRLESPRLEVAAGSIGLTGRQTGIYTERRPAGWNIVGRTPLLLVDVEDAYFPLRTGDRLRFERIDEATFARLHGKRLESV